MPWSIAELPPPVEQMNSGSPLPGRQEFFDPAEGRVGQLPQPRDLVDFHPRQFDKLLGQVGDVLDGGSTQFAQKGAGLRRLKIFLAE